MHIRAITVIILFLVSLVPTSAGSSVGVYADPEGRSTCANIAQPSQTLYVVYTNPEGSAPPIKAIQFIAPAPWCLQNADVLDEQVYPTTIGNSQYGVQIGFGECLSPPIHVLTINVFGGEVVEDCCWWEFTDVQVVDCNDQVITAPASGGMLAIEPCELTAPHSPIPSDGAVGVPTTCEFSWQNESPPVLCYGTPLVYNFYIGTDSNVLAKHIWVGPPYEVSGLLPGTRYYWQAEVDILAGDGPYLGPLWSFVTEGVVPSEQSTWGRIKSLFK